MEEGTVRRVRRLVRSITLDWSGLSRDDVEQFVQERILRREIKRQKLGLGSIKPAQLKFLVWCYTRQALSAERRHWERRTREDVLVGKRLWQTARWKERRVETVEVAGQVVDIWDTLEAPGSLEMHVMVQQGLAALSPKDRALAESLSCDMPMPLAARQRARDVWHGETCTPMPLSDRQVRRRQQTLRRTLARYIED